MTDFKFIYKWNDKMTNNGIITVIKILDKELTEKVDPLKSKILIIPTFVTGEPVDLLNAVMPRSDVKEWLDEQDPEWRFDAEFIRFSAGDLYPIIEVTLNFSSKATPILFKMTWL